MLASYNLLKKYVDLDGITYKEVADRLRSSQVPKKRGMLLKDEEIP